MKQYLYILIFVSALLPSPFYSFNISVACEAIKKQDIKTLKISLKNVVLSAQEKIILLDHATQAVQHHEKTARISSENKQSIFATLCVLSGGIWLHYMQEVLFGLALPIL